MISRKEWGARSPRSTQAIRPKGYALHWEGVTLGTFGHDKCARKIRDIQNYHMDVNGWVDIAYNFVVCPHGETYEGRGYGVRSAANGTNEANANYLAICALAGPGDPFTDAEKRGIVGLVGSQALTVHSDHFNTACPGDARRRWVKADHFVPVEPPKPIVYGPIQTFGEPVIRQEIQIPSLDKQGNGWVDTRIPWNKFVTCIIHGPAPDRDGYDWANIYWSANNTSGQARLEFEGGRAFQPLNITVWGAS